jgi:diguanylate cyclase (GGDEF)-like protein
MSQVKGLILRIWLIALLSICAIAAAVLVASETQRSAAQENFVEAETANDLHADILEQSQRVSDFLAGQRAGVIAEFHLELRSLHADFRTARELSADDLVEIAQLDRQEHASDQWHRLARRDIERARHGLPLLGESLDRRDQLLDTYVTANTEYRHRLAVNRQDELHAAALVPVRLVIGLGLLFGAIAFLIFRRQRRAALAREREQAQSAATEAAFVDSQARFGEALQVAQDQPEAHLLLKRQLEERIPGSSVVVLNRNNSANRLEPSEQLPDDDPLSVALTHAEPRSCLAVRLSRHYERGGNQAEILPCDLCGALESCSTCQPLLVGGEVIGSVLIEKRTPLDAQQRRQFDESVTKAAPVLANLRNLSIAQAQAVTDSLTGLPNKRAFDDAFKRMLAQAGRSLSPLSVVLLDLDHFKQVNDAYGHERGDEVLAALGALLRAQLRGADFPARYGGEEFIVLLPDTDRAGAMKIADELRRSLYALKISELTGPVTASFGVSTYPEDSTDPDHLIRTADRALYAAKQNGRDRVETVSKGERNGGPEKSADKARVSQSARPAGSPAGR